MRWLILPLLLFQSGCVVLRPDPEPFSRGDWAHLQSRLVGIPPTIEQAIQEEALSRLADDEVVSTNHLSASVNETLVGLLRDCHRNVLRSDSEFEQYNEVVMGAQVDPTESFSQALSNYLLDPEFPEQQPLFNRYFTQRYTGSSLPTVTGPVPFLITEQYEGQKIIWIDPRRVRSIHFLFAGNGEQFASRFGHVALRLVISPENQVDDEAANRNLYEHIVLGYMAHIDEFELSAITALRGNYQAYLFASPFMDVYRGYAINEFRDIYSVPLTLTDEDRERMVRELSEIHWRFSGSYKFFSSNCSGLLQEALRVLMPEYSREPRMKKKRRRPDRFFKMIRKTSLVESGVLDSLETAEQEGFYFPSTKAYYEKALSVVKSKMQTPPFDDVDSYLNRLPNVRIKAVVNDKAYFELLSLDTYTLEAQILMEELAMVRNERRLMAEGSRYFKDIDLDRSAEEAQLQLNEQEWARYDTYFLQPIHMMTTPIARLNGIPEETLKLLNIAPVSNSKPVIDREQLTELLTRIHPENEKQWRRVVAASLIVDHTMENILLLKELRNEK